MQSTLAFAPSPEDLEDLSFIPPVLARTGTSRQPQHNPPPAQAQTPVAGTPAR